MIVRIASPLWVRLLSVLAVAGFVATAGRGTGLAQVVLDGKFGTSGALTGPNYNITAAMGATRGNNLFQSFSQFDLKSGDVATFSGPANIQNIMSRVTGGSPSSIDGTIRSDIAGANFFFINPSGIMFGPNAAVNVSGSFAVSTANYLKLADGARFMAALDADDSLLSSAPVAAFGFLDGANGAIQVKGSLKAAPGTSLSFVGSDVSVVDGTRLEALNGRINLAGVTAPGEWMLPASSPSTGNGTLPASSASIVIRGGQLVVENARISSTEGGIDIALTEGLEVVNGGQITTSATGAIKGGNIAIDSPSVVVDGQDNSATPTRIAAETSSDNPQATGGDVVVHATSVQVLRGAEVSVSSFGAADAGQVNITTSTLLVDAGPNQSPTQIAANAAGLSGTASGAGGAIIVHADSVDVENGAALIASSLGDGNAGTINLSAGSLTVNAGTLTTFTSGAGLGGEIRLNCDNITLNGPFSSISATTFGLNGQLPAGNGGIIDITAGTLRLQNDAGISASTYGDSRGGDINIKANSLVLDTATSQGIFPGISASSNPDFFGGPGGGKGGDIKIVAGSLSLQNGMLISTTTSTPGDGGSIIIDAGSVTLNNKSSIQSASVAGGKAGTISLTSSQNILLTEDSGISTSAPQSSGGDIHVQAGGDIQLFDSKITAEAGLNGGNVSLAAPGLTYLLRSTVTGEADTTGSGFGNGGNLTIDPSFLILNQGSLISKSSFGNGGNINIFSDYFFQSASVIDASAPFGLPGTVTVTAPEVDLSGVLVGLPGNLLGLDTQLRPDCGVRLTGNISSFIVLSRGGLPIAPGGFVPSSVPEEQ